MGPWLTAGVNLVSGLIGQFVQSKHNKNLASYQNAYNDPASQMARYKAAGLNPNLVYTQGNPGNMSPIPTVDYAGTIGGQGTKYQQAEYLEEQTGLTSEKRAESRLKQKVLDTQEHVLSRNPLLDPRYFNAMVQNLVSTAQLKKHDTDFLTGQQQSTGATTQGQAKIMLDIERISSQLGLQEADAKLKAEILKSEQLKNAILEVQKKWLTEADITPQHIYQGIMLLLSKFM